VRRELRVVVDTNVWVSALVNPDGSKGQLIQAARAGRLEVVASWDLAEELIGALARRKLSRYRLSPEDEQEVLTWLGRSLPSVELNVQLRDPDDVVVVAAAVAGRADAIVTGDRGLLDDAELRSWLGERGIELLTPAELLERLA
jgi:putative PIN family toxin of toxin-antitoxin system